MLQPDSCLLSSLHSSLPYAYGEPLVTGLIRQQPQDFLVEEILGFEPEGEGEHVFLLIEKTGLNTAQVADRLARLANVPVRQVSYAGLKDRHAVTRQWFSVHLPGNQSCDWLSLNSADLSVLQQTRHLRKLRRGVHRGNQFVITITDLAGRIENLPARLEGIACHGVPNYFGEQRFGRNGMNLQQAQRWFAGEIKPKRQQQGFYLSAARSYLFNQVLAQRVKLCNWNRLSQRGELLMLEGSHSLFAQTETEDLTQRLADGDIHLTGPMYGKDKGNDKPGGLVSNNEVAELERAVLEQFPALLLGLEQAGLAMERRALRMIPSNFQWQLDNNRAEITFSLPRGCFATSVVRELAQYS